MGLSSFVRLCLVLYILIFQKKEEAIFERVSYMMETDLILVVANFVEDKLNKGVCVVFVMKLKFSYLCYRKG